MNAVQVTPEKKKKKSKIVLDKIHYLFLSQFLENRFRAEYRWHTTESFHKKLTLFLSLQFNGRAVSLANTR